MRSVVTADFNCRKNILMSSRNSTSVSKQKKNSGKDENSSYKQVLKSLGPGLITGASDDDPAGIATYSITGASLGYAPLWLALLTLPMMSAVQFTCAKIGIVTKKGLAGILRDHYPRPFLYTAVFLLFFANTLNVGADIAAIGAATKLLVPIPEMLTVVAVGVFIVALQIAGSYHLIARIFKWLTFALFAYIATAFLVKVDWSQALRNTALPTFQFTKEWITTVVAILGTTISPYLFFWQASQEVEELKDEQADAGRRPSKAETDQKVKFAAIDVNVGMVFSNTVMYFIILTCAATLHVNGLTEIKTATDAAKALEPLAGPWSKALFASGLIGTGLLAIPVLTGSAAYALSEAFGWKSSLDEKFAGAREFYICIIVSTALGILFNIFGVDAMTALYWSAIINGVVAPPVLVLIMLMANNKDVMGSRTNGYLTNCLGWATALVMSVAALSMLIPMGN